MEEFHPLDRFPTHDVNTRTRARTPRKWAIRSKFAYAKLALVMVVGGLAGEGIFEFLAARAETRIRQHDEKIVSDDEGEIAAVKADNLKLAIELEKEEQATANAEKSAAEANAKLGGWKLDDAAKKRFAKQVEKFSGTRFDLAVNPVEAPFMEELDALLTSPSIGWIEEPPKPQNGNPMAILIDGKASIILSSGIMLEVDQDQVAFLKPALIALGTALHEELGLKKIPLHFVPPGSWGNRIHIIIGKRE